MLMSFIIYAFVSGNKFVKKFWNLRDMNSINKIKPNESGQEATSGKWYNYSKNLLFLLESGVTATTAPRIETAESTTNQRSNSASCTKTVGRKIPGPPSKRRKDDTIKTTLPTPIPPDEDRAFFESLLHTVHRFNTDQKLTFRSEVLYLVRTMRMGIPPHSSLGYSPYRTQQPSHTPYSTLPHSCNFGVLQNNWPNQFSNSPPVPSPPITQHSNTTISSPPPTVHTISSPQSNLQLSVDDDDNVSSEN